MPAVQVRLLWTIFSLYVWDLMNDSRRQCDAVFYCLVASLSVFECFIDGHHTHTQYTHAIHTHTHTRTHTHTTHTLIGAVPIVPGRVGLPRPSVAAESSALHQTQCHWQSGEEDTPDTARSCAKVNLRRVAGNSHLSMLLCANMQAHAHSHICT